MKISFESFVIALEGTDLRTNKKVTVKIEGSQSDGFKMVTETEDSVPGAVSFGAARNSFVDMTNLDGKSDH